MLASWFGDHFQKWSWNMIFLWSNLHFSEGGIVFWHSDGASDRKWGEMRDRGSSNVIWMFYSSVIADPHTFRYIAPVCSCMRQNAAKSFTDTKNISGFSGILAVHAKMPLNLSPMPRLLVDSAAFWRIWECTGAIYWNVWPQHYHRPSHKHPPFKGQNILKVL